MRQLSACFVVFSAAVARQIVPLRQVEGPKQSAFRGGKETERSLGSLPVSCRGGSRVSSLDARMSLECPLANLRRSIYANRSKKIKV